MIDQELDQEEEEQEISPPFTPPSSPAKAKSYLFPVRSPFLIGVAGGTASGKTSVCQKIMEQLGQLDSSRNRVVMLSQDSFYRKLSSHDKKLANQGRYNFDHPGKNLISANGYGL